MGIMEISYNAINVKKKIGTNVPHLVQQGRLFMQIERFQCIKKYNNLL